MPKNLKKFVFILIGVFLSFFALNNKVFAYDNTSVNGGGVSIDSFYYNENEELVLTWSVQPYDYIMPYSPSCYPQQAEYIFIYDFGYNYLGVTNSYIQYYGGSTALRLYPDYIDCLNVLDGNNTQGIYSSDFGSLSCTMKFHYFTFYGDYYPQSGSYIKKSDIQSGFGGFDALTNSDAGTLSFVDNYLWDSSNLTGCGNTVIDVLWETTFPIVGTPSPVDGVCGLDVETPFNFSDWDLQTWCSSGDFYWSGAEYNGRVPYQCLGINGGNNVNCTASYYVNGDCGSVSHTSQSDLTIENENLCSYYYLLDESSFSATATGWSWICSGLYGGYDSFCSASKTTTSFPEVPELEDCSSYTFPNSWFCNINNTLKSAFLPSSEKMNELNLQINEIQQKAPFNYLNIAKTKISELTGNISQEELSITLLGNTSNINENALTTLAGAIKNFFTFLLMLAFIFWAIKYIKHFFK